MQGYVLKRKSNSALLGHYVRRYFVLKNSSLALYEKAGSPAQEPKDVIDLTTTLRVGEGHMDANTTHVTLNRSTQSVNSKLHFFIQTDKRVYNLKAESPASYTAWMSVLAVFDGAAQSSEPIPVPNVMRAALLSAIRYLQEHAVHTYGIFREAVRSTDTDELYDKLLGRDQDTLSSSHISSTAAIVNRQYVRTPRAVDVKMGAEVHVVATTLKRLLSDLPETVFTNSAHDRYLLRAEPPTLDEVSNLVNSLPDTNYEILWHLSLLMSDICTNQHETGMTVQNLELVLAEALLRKQAVPNPDAVFMLLPVLSELVNHRTSIFLQDPAHRVRVALGTVDKARTEFVPPTVLQQSAAALVMSQSTASQDETVHHIEEDVDDTKLPIISVNLVEQSGEAFHTPPRKDSLRHVNFESSPAVRSFVLETPTASKPEHDTTIEMQSPIVSPQATLSKVDTPSSHAAASEHQTRRTSASFPYSSQVAPSTGSNADVGLQYSVEKLAKPTTASLEVLCSSPQIQIARLSAAERSVLAASLMAEPLLSQKRQSYSSPVRDVLPCSPLKRPLLRKSDVRISPHSTRRDVSGVGNTTSSPQASYGSVYTLSTNTNRAKEASDNQEAQFWERRDEFWRSRPQLQLLYANRRTQ